ncbi:MAG: hypothetical protein HC811_13900 [Flammeovirgaceae bacterium]|nr:hypothetical protein [Flammeovirgaceae bacterium]
MDAKAANTALQEIISAKMSLADIDYNDPKYDELEEKLHSLEDVFLAQHGEAFEDILKDIHDEYCPDNDVLLPIAYLAKKYQITDGNSYSVANNEGVFVDSDDYAGKETRLVILPNPVRIVLTIGKDQQETVWSS